MFVDSQLTRIHEYLGIGPAHLAANKLTFQSQPPLDELRVVDVDWEGMPFVLISPAAAAWVSMTRAAGAEGVALLPMSGFRSYAYQRKLISRRLREGESLERVLARIAIPGFSEHHSGRAIDIHAIGRPELEEAFELTEAFAWLKENAGRFHFRLSYPRDNALGIVYEPWHWFFAGG